MAPEPVFEKFLNAGFDQVTFVKVRFMSFELELFTVKFFIILMSGLPL